MTPKRQLRVVLDYLRLQVAARLYPGPEIPASELEVAGAHPNWWKAVPKIDLGELAAIAAVAADLARAELDYAQLPDTPETAG